MITRIPTSLKVLFIGLLLAGCQTTPTTDLERVEVLKKQVQADALVLEQLKTKEFVQLERDFIACDSMLQYLHPEAVDEAFQDLQLTKAYIEQFKMEQPNIKADIDSTLYRLDCLRGDIKSHYLSDSLVSVYLDDETQHAEVLNNQVDYFKNRFGTCQSNLNTFRGKK